MKTISWNADKLKALKAAYDRAVAADKLHTDTISVELPGEREPATFVVGYAKYLIEHLETEFAKHPQRDFGPNLEGREGE